jgi:LysM repeat protein
VNGVADNTSLLEGTTLFIPADAPAYGQYPAIFRLDQFGNVAGEEYVIQPGDTLDAVAQEFDVSVISLKMANNIENSFTIQAGTVIIIPEGAAKYGEFPPVMRSDGTDASLGQGGGGPNEYVVQPGDYPQKIAREHNVDLITFMDVNGIDNSFRLMAGTVVVIPPDAPPFSEDGIPPVSVRSATDTTTSNGNGNTNTTNTVEQAQPTPTIESVNIVPVAPTATSTIAGMGSDAIVVTQMPAATQTIPEPVTTEQAP